MIEYSEVFVGLDVSKNSHAVAIAEAGRKGEVRYFGEIPSDAASVRRLVRKLERPGMQLRFCYEAGPTDFGLQRELDALGHECVVVAPSLVPRRPGDRVKTNRRDAQKLARLYRAGELTEIWIPDASHEAMRDLVRARESAVIKGRKRHALVDTDGRALLLEPHPADVQDRDAGGPVLQVSRSLFPFIENLFADSAYNHDRVKDATGIVFEIISKITGQTGFIVLPRRWVVERFFAWINRDRRLAKDVEATIKSARAFLYAASIMLLVRRLARTT